MMAKCFLHTVFGKYCSILRSQCHVCTTPVISTSFDGKTILNSCTISFDRSKWPRRIFKFHCTQVKFFTVIWNYLNLACSTSSLNNFDLEMTSMANGFGIWPHVHTNRWNVIRKFWLHHRHSTNYTASNSRHSMQLLACLVDGCSALNFLSGFL